MNLNIGILDLGLGNVNSLYKMCLKFENASFINCESDWDNYDLVIFPGVGSYDSAMRLVNKYNIKNKILKHINNNKYFMGICIGMQILFEGSEEGVEPGCSIFEGFLKKFNSNLVVVPHMMWDKCVNNNFPFELNDVFYFTHSFAIFEHSFSQYLSTEYDLNFLSAFYSRNILGTQFHPEKSGSNGVDFFKNYFEFVRSNL